MNSEFKTVKTDDYQCLFVNTVKSPDKQIALDHYRYTYDGEYTFYRLYKDIYCQDGVINHSVLEWYEIEVKQNCVKSMISMINLISGASEFIQR